MSDPAASVSCERLVALLLDYLEGGLDAGTHAAIDAHLAHCPGCLEFTSQYKKTPVICRESLRREMPADLRDHLAEFVLGQQRQQQQ